MWKSSDSKSRFTLWPPDAAQQQKSTSFFYPTYAKDNEFLSVNAFGNFPGFGAHGSSLHVSSAFTQLGNPQSLNHTNGSSGKGITNAMNCVGEGCATHKKRFLIFDQSGDRTNLIFSSAGNPQQVWNPILPATNGSCAYASDCLETEVNEEMHEDTDEIDALLYSDSENSNSYNSEEASTGHSPAGMEEEGQDFYPIPSKRRKVQHSEPGNSLSDTASSAVVPSRHFVVHDENADDVELSFVCSGNKLEDDSSAKVVCGKRERIQTTVNLLRRIIPSGKGKDTAAVLDDAIRYLKSLRLQAEALGLHMD